MTETRPVLFFDRERVRIKQVADRLALYGMIVVEKVDPCNIFLALRQPESYSAIVLRLEWRLLDTHFRESIEPFRSGTGSPPMIIIAGDADTERFFRRSAIPAVTLLKSGSPPDVIVRSILSRGLPSSACPAAAPDGHELTLGITRLSGILAYCRESGFTGEVLFQDGETGGRIGIRGGSPESAEAGGEREASVESILARHERPMIRLRQYLINTGEVERFLNAHHSEDGPSLKDLLIDVFYFMHTAFLEVLTPRALRRLVVTTFSEDVPDTLRGIALEYDETLQEKLRITGEVSDDETAQIIAVFESLYDDILRPSRGFGLPVFIDSLEEIRPYLKRLEIHLDHLRR